MKPENNPTTPTKHKPDSSQSATVSSSPPERPKMTRPPLFSLISLITLILLLGYIAADRTVLSPRIAYVNTGKLMVGFSEAAKVEREVAAEEEKWKEQLGEMEKELKAAIDSMSVEFNSASAVRKKELQDMLSARNQQINNFKQANARKMDELKVKKMNAVVEKVNVYMAGRRIVSKKGPA
jgi:Skp family chaperone for outer membrane proteins